MSFCLKEWMPLNVPSKDQHLDKALDNEAFYGAVRSSLASYEGWQVTTIFYAALHYIDAYMATMNRHPKRHQDRDLLISRESKLRRIAPDYFALRDRSIDARYEVVNFPSGFPQLKFTGELNRIRSHIQPLL